jgi:hypothetical protein
MRELQRAAGDHDRNPYADDVVSAVEWLELDVKAIRSNPVDLPLDIAEQISIAVHAGPPARRTVRRQAVELFDRELARARRGETSDHVVLPLDAAAAVLDVATDRMHKRTRRRPPLTRGDRLRDDAILAYGAERAEAWHATKDSNGKYISYGVADRRAATEAIAFTRERYPSRRVVSVSYMARHIRARRNTNPD